MKGSHSLRCLLSGVLFLSLAPIAPPTGAFQSPAPETAKSSAAATQRTIPPQKGGRPVNEPTRAEQDSKQTKKSAGRAQGQAPRAQKNTGPVQKPSTAVLSPSPIQVDMRQQIVRDSKKLNSEKIVFTADLGVEDFKDFEEGFTNMEDVSLTSGVQPFLRQSNLRYEVKGGVFTCDVPIVRSATTDISYSFTVRIEANKSTRPYILSAKGEIGQSRDGRSGLTGVMALGAAAVGLITALVVLILWSIRRRRRQQAVVYVKPPSPIQQKPIQPLYQKPANDPYSAFDLQQRASEPEVHRAVRDNSQRIAALEQSLSSLLGRPTDEWRRVLGDISDLQMVASLIQPPFARQMDLPGSGREETTLVAVVNQWINSGATNRQQMLSMANEIGQEMKLMQHVNVARLLSDVTALGSADFAESVTDGGWLCCIGHDGLSMLAPADSRLFQSAQDRALLQRMFDGVDSGTGPVQFAQIYRPCRLRIKQAPNRYEVVQKGLLHLSGQPRPGIPSPRDYLSLRQEIQKPGITVNSAPTLVSVVRGLLEGLLSRLANVENLLNGLTAQSQSPISASRIRDLDQLTLPLRRELQAVENRLSQEIEQRLRVAVIAPPTAAGSSPTATNILGEQVAGMRSLLQDLSARMDRIETDLAPAVRSRMEPTIAPRDGEPVPAVSARSALASVAAASVSSSKPPQVIPTDPASATENVEQSPGNGWGLPSGWQEVVAGIEAFRGLAERDLAESLQKMQMALQQLPGRPDIRLVHLMESMGKFQVHNASMSREGQLFCRACDGPRTFQAAVCGGREGSPELQVLFAAGDYAPYNYPAGYRQLIQNIPNEQFQIRTVLAPAVLTLIAGTPNAEYTVQYKLQWR